MKDNSVSIRNALSKQVWRQTSLAAGSAAIAMILAACSTGASSSATSTSDSANSLPTTVVSPAVATNAQSEVPVISSRNGRVRVDLTAAESQVPYDGTQRWAMTYNGGATGPTIRVHPGDKMTITLVNNLNQPTSLHTHGLHVAPVQDNPFSMVDPGQTITYNYDIPKDQQAGTYWYHPHVHTRTAEQVASGLSGAIIVEDNTDTALAKVSTDHVLVINDPPLSTTNPWNGGNGSSTGMGSMMGGSTGMNMGSGSMMGGSSGMNMMAAMTGRTGPRLLTNGTDGVTFAPSSGKLERTHVVNATASTQLRLTFDGKQMLQLASPGGRLAAARHVTSIDLAPGQRTEVVLIPGPSGGVLSAQRLSNEGNAQPVGATERIAGVSATAGMDASKLPVAMTANTRDLFAPSVQVDAVRTITLDGHMNPTIDGKLFDPNTINFTAKKGTVEEWIIKSNSPMVHPIHLHSWPFQVQGEQGWNDVVSVPAYGQKVIRVAFDDFGGTTVLHCHILDHEDTGMMAIIKVTD